MIHALGHETLLLLLSTVHRVPRARTTCVPHHGPTVTDAMPTPVPAPAQDLDIRDPWLVGVSMPGLQRLRAYGMELSPDGPRPWPLLRELNVTGPPSESFQNTTWWVRRGRDAVGRPAGRRVMGGWEDGGVGQGGGGSAGGWSGRLAGRGGVITTLQHGSQPGRFA